MNLRRFRVPRNGNDVFWYSFDYSPLVHVVMLSSEHHLSAGSAQHEWLVRDLERVRGGGGTKEPLWVVVTLHRMLYTTQLCEESDSDRSLLLREQLEPTLRKYRVNLVLVGHQHSYERSCTVFNGTCIGNTTDAGGSGTVHVTVGTAGAGVEKCGFDRTGSKGNFSVARANKWGYARVAATQQALRLEFVTNEDGAVYDTATLAPWPASEPPVLKSDDSAARVAGQESAHNNRTLTGFSVHVADNGLLTLSSRDGSVVFTLNSSFSEAAAAGHGPPFLHRLGGGQQPHSLSVALNETTWHWHVRVAGGAYNFHREISIEGSHVLVKDTIETSSPDWHHLASDTSAIGLQVNHSIQLTTGNPVAASVPGELYAFSCSNANAARGEDGKAKYQLNRGGFGNPSIHAETTTGGVAVVPLDDVFESHAVGTQAVIERYPRMPSSLPSCPVTHVPSISLADPYLALPPSSSHTMEFAIYVSRSHPPYRVATAAPLTLSLSLCFCLW